MLVKRLEVTNFGGFEQFSTDLEPLTVLTGPNNGGKTTLLRAIQIAIGSVQTGRVAPVSPPNMPGLTPPKAPTHAPVTFDGDLEKLAKKIRREDPSLLNFRKDGDRPFTIRLLIETTTAGRICLVASRNEMSLRTQLTTENGENLLAKLRKATDEIRSDESVQFLPFVGDINPTENILSFQNLSAMRDQGEFTPVWRNQLHWLTETRDPEDVMRVVQRVAAYVPGIRLRSPGRSRNERSVDLVYEEDGQEYDISASGSGLRTIITLVAFIELSPASVLLLDEPDAHLHSSVQRQLAVLLQEAVLEKQIILTSHAPDLIDAMSVDNLYWIDRRTYQAVRPSNVGRALADLGAINHVRAARLVDSKVLLFVEGDPDHRAYRTLIEKCGNNALKSAGIETLGGFGNIDKLPGVLAMLKELQGSDIAIIAIRDSDYKELDGTGRAVDHKGVLLVNLPCKELENLLLIDATSIHRLVADDARRRSDFTSKECPVPTIDEIGDKIDELSKDEEIYRVVRNNWSQQWLSMNGLDTVPQMYAGFDERWASAEWRRRCCPGKEVLKLLRAWLQKDYKLSLGSGKSFFRLYEPSTELQALLNAMEQHAAAVLK